MITYLRGFSHFSGNFTRLFSTKKVTKMTGGFIYIIDQPEILKSCVKMGRTADEETLKGRYTTYYPKCDIHTFAVNNMESCEKFLFELAKDIRIFPEHELFRCNVAEAIDYCEKVKKIDEIVYGTRDDIEIVARYIEITGLCDHPLKKKIADFSLKDEENTESLDEHFIAHEGKIYRLLECKKDAVNRLYTIEKNVVRKNCGVCKEAFKTVRFKKLRAIASDGFSDNCMECDK